MAAHATEQLDHEAGALEIRVECKLLEALGRLLGDLEAAERVEGGLRERAVGRLRGLHQRVDDLGARLVGLEREAEGDDRLLAHAGVLLLVVGVREERGHGLLVLEVAEDLHGGGDGAVRVLLLLLRLEELLGLGEVAAPLVTVGVLDLLAHREGRRLGRLAVARGEALDERGERVLAAELGERGVERAALLGIRRRHLRLDERHDLVSDAGDAARGGAAHVVGTGGEQREHRGQRLLRADSRERIERAHLEERNAAGEHLGEALDDARPLGLELSEDDGGRDLLLDGLALQELDDLDDFAHFSKPSRNTPRPFSPRAGHGSSPLSRRRAGKRHFSTIRVTMEAWAGLVAGWWDFWPFLPES